MGFIHFLPLSYLSKTNWYWSLRRTKDGRHRTSHCNRNTVNAIVFSYADESDPSMAYSKWHRRMLLYSNQGTATVSVTFFSGDWGHIVADGVSEATAANNAKNSRLWQKGKERKKKLALCAENRKTESQKRKSCHKRIQRSSDWETGWQDICLKSAKLITSSTFICFSMQYSFLFRPSFWAGSGQLNQRPHRRPFFQSFLMSYRQNDELKSCRLPAFVLFPLLLHSSASLSRCGR